METTNVNDSKAEVHVEISTNLLETSQREPDLNQTEQDFLHQNEIINQELRKYDGCLNTWPLIAIKAWMTCYMIYLSGYFLHFLISLFSSLPRKSILSWVIFALEILNPFMICASAYGCILLWMAIGSKDLFKVERCLSIFKIFLIWNILVMLWSLCVMFYIQTWSWLVMKGCIFGVLISVPNLGMTLYVKKVLLKRDVFQQVLGSPNK